jgi:tRNA threonylcarbamoyl adenosine modification protein YeaZ
MRYILGIDTANRFGSVALAVDGSASGWATLDPGEHSSGLSRASEDLLRERDLTLRDLSGIAVSEGPGSFTGLRIGLAWAKGICFGLPAKLTLVSSHEANAYRHRFARGLIATVLQGERGQVQASLWSAGAKPGNLWGPERIPEEDLADALRKAAGPKNAAIWVAAPDLKPGIRGLLEEAGFVLLDGRPGSRGGTAGGAEPLPPTAAAVAELGDRNLLAGRIEDLADAAPSYGRAPNARKPSS